MSLASDIDDFVSGTTDTVTTAQVRAAVIGDNPSATLQQVRDICIATYRVVGQDAFRYNKQHADPSVYNAKKAVTKFINTRDEDDYTAAVAALDVLRVL